VNDHSPALDWHAVSSEQGKLVFIKLEQQNVLHCNADMQGHNQVLVRGGGLKNRKFL